MGWKVTCGTCGAEVYVTGTRLPPHEVPADGRCPNKRKAREPVEYAESIFESDPGVYQGGLPTLGKDRR